MIGPGKSVFAGTERQVFPRRSGESRSAGFGGFGTGAADGSGDRGRIRATVVCVVRARRRTDIFDSRPETGTEAMSGHSRFSACSRSRRRGSMTGRVGAADVSGISRRVTGRSIRARMGGQER